MSDRWLVRLPTWLGDTMMALPVLRAAARASEGPPVFWGPPGRDGLLRHGGLEFDYLPYRRAGGLRGVSDAIHVTAELRYRAADAALLLPNAFEPALLVRAAGVPRRVGFATDGRGPLLTDRVGEPTPRHAVHEADRFARLAEHLDWTPGPDDHLLRPTPELLGVAEEVLPPGDNYLGIVAGSANTPAKRWPAADYAELARRAHSRWGATPVLLGADDDRATNRQIAGLVDNAAIDLSGCDLADLAGALLRCRVVVSNDTGAAHLAAALGCSTAVLFGPTDPARSGPRGPGVVSLSAQLFCQPCGYGECPIEHRCMSELKVNDVLESLQPFWQGDA